MTLIQLDARVDSTSPALQTVAQERPVVARTPTFVGDEQDLTTLPDSVLLARIGVAPEEQERYQADLECLVRQVLEVYFQDQD